MLPLIAAIWAGVALWRAVRFSREMDIPAFPWSDFDVNWDEVPDDVKRAARRAWLRGVEPDDIRGALYVIRLADTWRSMRVLIVATTFMLPVAVAPLVIADAADLPGWIVIGALTLGILLPWRFLRRWRRMLAGERAAADVAWRASGRG